MPTPSTEIEQLKAEIVDLEARFARELARLREQVKVLEKAKPAEVVSPALLNEPLGLSVQLDSQGKAEQEVLSVNEPLNTPPPKPPPGQLQRPPAAQPRRVPQKPPAPKVEQPWEVPAFLADFFLPLGQFRDFLADTYRHYQAQNRLPVFFMTVGGIVAILLGFSYLLQFVPDFYFEVVKVVGIFAASLGTLFTGLRLVKKAAKYHDFGSALLGLGVAINFLLFYYLAGSEAFPVFGQVVMGFGLILANTAVAQWLALRHQTKIVLTVSLLGGVFSPFYLNTSTIPLFYFGYLWLLCAAAVYVAARIKWQVAEILTFVTASTALGLALGNVGPAPWVETLIFTAFAYLFFYVSLFADRRPKATLDRQSVGILVGAAGLLLLHLYWIYEPLGQRGTLGGLYLANATIFLVGYFVWRRVLAPPMQVLCFIMVGTFVGLAVPALLDRNLRGVFWALEGVALVFCGFNFRLPGVRAEGYLILLVALYQIFASFGEIFQNWGVWLWTDGFLNLLSLGVVMGALQWLLRKHGLGRQPGLETNNGVGEEPTQVLGFRLAAIEARLPHWLAEALPIWLGLVVWLPCLFYLRELTYNLALVGLYGFVWWGLRHRLQVTEWFGWLHLGLVLLGVATSVEQVNSYIFPFQTLLGKVAVVEVFVSLWALQFFYEKIRADSPSLPIMRVLREIFYLAVPLLHLSYINRVYPDYLPVALWAAVLFGFGLNELVQRRALRVEIHMMATLATWALLGTLDNRLVGYLAAGSGLAILFGILVYKKGYLLSQATTSPYRYLFACAFYYVGWCVWLLVIALTTQPDLASAMLATGLYLLVISYFRAKIAPLQLHHNYRLAFRAGVVVGALGLGLIFVDKILVWGLVRMYEPLAFGLGFAWLGLLGYVAYRRRPHYPLQADGAWLADLWLTHLFLALAYSALIGHLLPNWMGVWLTVGFFLHAIGLLFNSTVAPYQSLLRLSVGFFGLAALKLFWRDLAGFQTVQKVVVFMAVGLLMLAGSYLFMRFREKR